MSLQKDYEELAVSVMSIVDRLVHKTNVASVSLLQFTWHHATKTFCWVTRLSHKCSGLSKVFDFIAKRLIQYVGKDRIFDWYPEGDIKACCWWKGRDCMASYRSWGSEDDGESILLYFSILLLVLQILSVIKSCILNVYGLNASWIMSITIFFFTDSLIRHDWQCESKQI